MGGGRGRRRREGDSKGRGSRPGALAWWGDQYAGGQGTSITVFGSDIIRMVVGEEGDSARAHTSAIPYRILSV